MTLEQRGAYITLLCLQHQQGHLTPSDVENITTDPKVLSKFLTDGDGNYYNEVMEMRTNERKAYCESRIKNRTKKDVDGERYEKDMKNICSTYDQHMENENKDVSEVSLLSVGVDVKAVDVKGGSGGEPEKGAIFGDMPAVGINPQPDAINARNDGHFAENGAILPPPQPSKAKRADFERFWAAYPRKQDEINAWVAWQSVKAPVEVVIEGVERAKRDDPSFGDIRFIPYPARWLERRGWTDRFDPVEAKPSVRGSRYGPQPVDKADALAEAMAAVKELKCEREAKGGRA